MVTRKSFNVKFTAKMDFRSGILCYLAANADIESLKSLHHSKKLQRILQCFTVKLLQRTIVSAIYSGLLLFFYIYFRQILCFLHCKM